jgi:hypothetical protein
MRTKMIMIAAAGVTSLIVSALPARAAIELPGFVCQTAPEGGNLTICVKGEAQLIPIGSASAIVVVACEAVVQGVVTATTVGCQLNALAGGAYGNAPNLSIPGPSSVSGFVNTVPIQSYAICVGGNYVALNGNLGNSANWAASGCFTTLL